MKQKVSKYFNNCPFIISGDFKEEPESDLIKNVMKKEFIDFFDMTGDRDDALPLYTTSYYDSKESSIGDLI